MDEMSSESVCPSTMQLIKEYKDLLVDMLTHKSHLGFRKYGIIDCEVHDSYNHIYGALYQSLLRQTNETWEVY